MKPFHRPAAIAGGLALALAVAPAMAGTTTLEDAAQDALRITSDGGIAYGDFDIDLRSIYIDHGTRDLQITSRFTYLDPTSWNQLYVSLDTNGDSVADYSVLWDTDEGISGVVQEFPGAEPVATCVGIGTSQKYGANGTATVKLPRSCIGSPSSVRVHVDVMWAGLSQSGTDLYFVDSAPGELIDEPVTFSQAVASSNTGTATSPAAPKVRTKLTASLSKTKAKAGATSAKLTIKPTAAGNPAGKVTIADGGKRLRTISTRAGKKTTYTLPRNLKPGKHTIKVTFTPKDPKKYLGATKSLKLTVVR